VSPRWRKVLLDLIDNRSRTVLIVLSIAIGIISVGFVAGARGTIAQGLADTYEKARPAHAVLSLEPFDDGLVEVVRAVPGVAIAEGRRELNVRMFYGGDEWRDSTLFGISDFRQVELGRIYPDRGIWPPGEGEVLLERASLAHMHKQIGDTIWIELPDGTRRELPIVGTAHGLDQAPAHLSNVASGYITLATLDALGAGRQFNQLYLRVDRADPARVAEVAGEVRLKAEEADLRVLKTRLPPLGRFWANDAIESLLGLLTILGLVATGMSGLLVVNTISSVLSQHVRQIGVMKSIGADTGQLTAMYLALVIGFGLLAMAVAVPLALYASLGLAGFIARLINVDLPPFELSPGVLLVEALAGLGVPLAAALYPVRAGSRITVRDAISSYGVAGGEFGTGPIDRLLGSLRGISRPVAMSLRNTFRQKGRLALTMATLVLGCAMFVSALSVRVSLFKAMDDAFGYADYDVKVVFDQTYGSDAIARAARSVPGVVDVESWQSRFGRRIRSGGGEGSTIELIAPPVGSRLVHPIVDDGRWLVSGDQNAIVINRDLLRDEPDLRVGDDLTLRVDSEDTRWRVVGLVRGQLGGPIAYVNQDYLAKLVGEVGLASNAQVAIRDHSRPAQSEAARALADHFKNVGLRTNLSISIDELRGLAGGSFGILVSFLMVMAILLSAVGGLGLMGTMSLNVLERTREIGVMRAIGASDGAIFRVVAAEGLIIGVLSWGLGVALAAPLSRLLVAFVASTFLHGPMTYVFSTGGALLLLPLILLLTLVASFVPALNASRLTVRDVLAYY
jgi:putative ABC transport system permease protein